MERLAGIQSKPLLKKGVWGFRRRGLRSRSGASGFSASRVVLLIRLLGLRAKADLSQSLFGFGILGFGVCHVG